jgi:hypothetical protein
MRAGVIEEAPAFLLPYSPECVEVEFCALRMLEFLGNLRGSLIRSTRAVRLAPCRAN